MDTQQKAAFAAELIDRVKAELIADIRAGRLPEEWDGIELRALIADRFRRARMGAESDRRRWGRFRNELIVRNL